METPELVSDVHKRFLEAVPALLPLTPMRLYLFRLGKMHLKSRLLLSPVSAAEPAGGAVNALKSNGDKKRLSRVAVPPAFGSYRPDLFDASRVADILTPLIKAQILYAVDVWLIETASSVEEAEAVVSLIKQHFSLPYGCHSPLVIEKHLTSLYIALW